MDTAESQVAADLVRDYLEHYKLDYTLSIFIPEANLKDTPIDRSEVARKAGVDVSSNEPLLVSLIKNGSKWSGDALPSVKGKNLLEPLTAKEPAKKSSALDAVESKTTKPKEVPKKEEVKKSKKED